MKMTDDAVKGGSTEVNPVSSKKLKQARLPFQILSPSDKHSEQKIRKRKASSNSDDVVIEVDVKENHGVIPDKKIKLECKDEVKQKVKDELNLNILKGKHPNKDHNDSMEVDINVTDLDVTEINNVLDQSLHTDINKSEKFEDKCDSEFSCTDNKKDNIENVIDIKEAVTDVSLEEVKNESPSDTSIVSCEGDISTITTGDSITDSECGNITNNDESFSDTSLKKCDSTLSHVTKGTPKQRKQSAKQLLRQSEKQKKLEEKQRLREEKIKKIAEKKEEQLRLKNEKAQAKIKEKEEKEKKRLAEIEAKNEEKRLKEEEKRAKEEERKKKEEAKEEERKKKDEEKRQKELERKLKEEAKNAEHRKSAAAFVNFFVPKKSDSKTQNEEIIEVVPEAEKFMPFEVKVDMRLAPSLRKELVEDDREKLDVALQNQSITSESLYVQMLKSGRYIPSKSDKTWPNVDEDDDVFIVEAENTEGSGKEVNQEKEGEKSTQRTRAKLLQFHENRRPPYWGTWRKNSRDIRPRAPFNMDKTMLEYEVDSDDEWEDIEDGESLRGSEDEESQDENYEEDNEMFVPHGYLSEEEGQDEVEDMSPEAQKAKLKLLQLEFEAERNEKQERQKPRLIGCVWFRNTDDDPAKVGSHIAELFLIRRAVWDGELPLNFVMDADHSKERSPQITPNNSSQHKSRAVPDSVIPQIISLIHGNRYRSKFLTQELYNRFQIEVKPNPSRRMIERKIRELATWMPCPIEEGPPVAKRKCWYVSQEIREAYGLKDLKASHSLEWQYTLSPPSKKFNLSVNSCESPLTNTSPAPGITKFTKVLSVEERQHLLQSNLLEKVSQSSPSTKTTPKPKKRVSLVSVPPGQEIPKQKGSNLMDKFVKAGNAAANSVTNQNKIGDTQNSKRNIPKTLTKADVVDDCIIID